MQVKHCLWNWSLTFVWSRKILQVTNLHLFCRNLRKDTLSACITSRMLSWSLSRKGLDQIGSTCCSSCWWSWSKLFRFMVKEQLHTCTSELDMIGVSPNTVSIRVLFQRRFQLRPGIVGTLRWTFQITKRFNYRKSIDNWLEQQIRRILMPGIYRNTKRCGQLRAGDDTFLLNCRL